MLIRAIDRADVTVWPMAFQADLLLRPSFSRNVNGTIEIAEHGVVQLFYAIELGLEVSSRAGTNMAVDTCHLRVRGVLGRDNPVIALLVTVIEIGSEHQIRFAA